MEKGLRRRRDQRRHRRGVCGQDFNDLWGRGVGRTGLGSAVEEKREPLLLRLRRAADRQHRNRGDEHQNSMQRAPGGSAGGSGWRQLHIRGYFFRRNPYALILLSPNWLVTRIT